jgi:cytochrome c peroxidase
MRFTRLAGSTAICAAAIAACSIYSLDHAQAQSASPIYNPYPPGILPPDLDSEIARVLREVDVIEGRAIERWHSLPPPTPFGDAPGPESARP